MELKVDESGESCDMFWPQKMVWSHPMKTGLDKRFHLNKPRACNSAQLRLIKAVEKNLLPSMKSWLVGDRILIAAYYDAHI